VYAKKVGKLKVFYEQETGEHIDFILNSIQYIPNFWVNLFSLTAAMSRNCTISSVGQVIVMEKNGLEVKFDKEIKRRMVLFAEQGYRLSPPTTSRLWLLETKSAKTSMTYIKNWVMHPSLLYVRLPNFITRVSQINSITAQVVPWQN